MTSTRQSGRAVGDFRFPVGKYPPGAVGSKRLSVQRKDRAGSLRLFIERHHLLHQRQVGGVVRIEFLPLLGWQTPGIIKIMNRMGVLLWVSVCFLHPSARE